MNYQLIVATFGHSPVEIEQERFEAIRKARRILLEAFALEEKYDILLANYVALEKKILRRALSGLINTTVEYSDAYESQLSYNLCFINLLTSARLYIDQVPRHVRECLPKDTDGFTRARTYLRDVYDSSFNYRFMEALRNHVQHNGIPIHKVSMGTSRNADDFLESGIALTASKELLAEDSKFKKQVLDESKEEIDLIVAARSYMGSLNEIHLHMRDLIGSEVETARLVIEHERARYKESLFLKEDLDLTGFEAQAVDKGQMRERIPLLLDWDDIRLKLQARNGRLRNLHKQYVSGRSRMKT